MNQLLTPVKRGMPIFLLIFIFLCTSVSKAEAGISLSADPEDISLLEAIPLLSRKHNVYFTYDRVLIAKVRVNYDADYEGPIDNELARLLKGTKFQFKIFGDQFIILYKQDEEGIQSIKEMLKHFEVIIADNEEKSEPKE